MSTNNKQQSLYYSTVGGDPNFQSFIPIDELVANVAKRQALKSYVPAIYRVKEVNSVTLFPATVGLRTILGLGNDNEGGRVAIADINGKPDVILMGVDAPVKENRFWCKVLFDLDKNGFPSRESTTVYNIQASEYNNAGGGIKYYRIPK